MSGQANQFEHDSKKDQWMNLKDAAELTNLSQKTLRRYVKKRMVKSRRLGKAVNSPLEIYVDEELMKVKETVERDSAIDVSVAVDAEFSHVFDSDSEEQESKQSKETEHDTKEAEIDSNETQVGEGSTDDTAFEKDDDYYEKIAEQLNPKLKAYYQYLATLTMEPLLKKLDEKEAKINELNSQVILLPDLQSQKERLEGEYKDKISTLNNRIVAIEDEKSIALKASSLASENVSKAEKRNKELEDELNKYKSEIEQLKKPWWKKWFLPQEDV